MSTNRNSDSQTKLSKTTGIPEARRLPGLHDYLFTRPSSPPNHFGDKSQNIFLVKQPKPKTRNNSAAQASATILPYHESALKSHDKASSSFRSDLDLMHAVDCTNARVTGQALHEANTATRMELNVGQAENDALHDASKSENVGRASGNW